MTVFTKTVIPSRYDRTIIRFINDDIVWASRSRVSFVLSSWIEKRPIPWMIIGSNNDAVTMWQDVITKGKMDTRSQHEKWAFARTSVNLFACERFCLRSWSCCRSLENITCGPLLLSLIGFTIIFLTHARWTINGT